MGEYYGHWNTTLVGHFTPDQWCGFIYQITHHPSNTSYIGKKSFSKGTKWQTYTSSSSEMKALIRQDGKESCEFLIIELCRTPRELTYAECRHLFTVDALRHPRYLNGNIMGRFFRSQFH